MHKVYFERRYIVISGQPDRLQKYCLFHKYHDIDELYEKIRIFISDPEIANMNIYSYKEDALWRSFRSFFDVHIAAGGLVTGNNNDFLFIRRYNRWDIPKGHIAGDESLEECARREIEEETGIIPEKKMVNLRPSYHTYRSGKKWILKDTSWFIFSWAGKGEPKPQEEEGITEIRWFGTDQIEEVHRDTWPSVSEVVNQALAYTGSY